MCLICAAEKLGEMENLKPGWVNLMINWEIFEMKSLYCKMSKSIKDYEQWEVKIKRFGNTKGTLNDFRKLLKLGDKYSTTRMYQQVRQTIEEADKARFSVANLKILKYYFYDFFGKWAKAFIL